MEISVRDRRGNVVSFTDRAGAVFTTQFDLLDRPFIKTGPDLNGVQEGQIYTFDANGRLALKENNLAEAEEFVYDAVGRVTGDYVYSGDGSLARAAKMIYSLDHHSVTSISGLPPSGSAIGTPVTNVVFTDTFGQTVLAQSFPGSSITNWTANSYDLAENLLYSRDEMGQTNGFTYDGLNRLKKQTLPDGKTITLGYDASGNLISRAMPAGLTWSATYDNANRKLTEQLATGSQTNRQFAWQYFTSGANVGLVQKTLDLGRGASNTLAYDSLLRVTNNAWTGSLSEHSLSLGYQYDRHGLITTLAQVYGGGTNTVSRTYDVLGELTGESVAINGVNQIGFSESWDAGLRRSGLAVVGTPMTWAFTQRGDGQLSQVVANQRTYSFGYDYSGQLRSRTNPWRNQTISRDGQGRISTLADTVGPNTALSESLGWRADSKLTSYTATRWGTGAWNDSRTFNYNSRDQLTTEGVGLATSVTATDTHAYDSGGLGVHVSSTLSSGATNNWSTTLDGFSRALVETINQGSASVMASGLAVGSASLGVTLNGTSQSGVLFDPKSSDGKWRVSLSAPVGTNKVIATGTLPISGNSTTATNTFIVLAQDSITDSYDGAGNLVTRTMTGSRTQTLKWDALGQLVNVQQVDTGGNGYTFTSIYDGLGRRIRTVQTTLTNSVAVSGSTVTVDSYFDPLVEFLELGVSVNGTRTWKVYGPDLSGGYGAQQGIGGLEATIRESDGLTTGLISDAFGNILATTTALNQVNWTSMRVSGFGPVEGYQVPILSPSTSLAEVTLWRGKRIDPTGYYHFGVRYHDPVAGRFISPDSMGHSVSLSLYDYCGNDPFNRIDPDGRLASGAYNGGKDLLAGTAELGYSIGGSIGYGVTSLFNGDYADQIYGDQWNHLKNVGSGLSYLADQISDGNFETIGKSVTGGEDKSASYRVGYGAITIASMIFGGEFGEAGEIAQTSRATEMIDEAGNAAINAEKAAAKLGQRGITRYDVTYHPTSSTFLNQLGFKTARISNIQVEVSMSLTPSEFLNVSAHESVHVAFASNLPNLAATTRLPYFGAFVLYGEEVAAYGYGAIRTGNYAEAALAPLSAFGSMTLGEAASVAGTGAALYGSALYSVGNGP
ncbi:MAG TPA: RHS repeat-associated core domain-containing protein [Candidatus Limnocylindria bacterium]|nr:RHS repeat-associated core domain-containing protein [Candidatus Limnocylindria bacterium]